MTSVPIIVAGRILAKVIESDHDHWYGLSAPVDYGEITTDRFPAFDYSDDFLDFRRLSPNSFNFSLKAFDPSAKVWDGTSNLPDHGTATLDALFKASVGHDVIYSRASAISRATGIPEADILAFADDFFKLSADGYGASKKVTKGIWRVLRFLGPLYHRIMKFFAVLLILSSVLAVPSGCTSFDDPGSHTTIHSTVPDLPPITFKHE